MKFCLALNSYRNRRALNVKNQTNQDTTLAALTSYWKDRAKSYSAQNIAEMNDWRREAWRKLILSYAPEKEVLRVLDIGTGPGFFAINLALAGHEVTAVDVTEEMLQYAKSNAKSYGAKVDFVLHRGESLPFTEESFDLIVNRNVIWNLEYPKQALTEWKRVLAPSGRMVYFDANWYLYLYDEALCARKKEAEKEFRARHPIHNFAGDLPRTRMLELEQTAYALPLSKEKRPEWDKKVLEELGLKLVEVLEDAGFGVQDPLDRERDSQNPLFMICAEKPEADNRVSKR